MASKIDTPPIQARRVQSGRSLEDRVIAHENVSITTYANGTRRASHARLDTSNNRMVFTALSDPIDYDDCPHGLAHWLADAAREHELDVTAQGGLW